MENNPTPPAAATPETPAIGGPLPDNVLRVEGILDLDSNKAGTLIDITRNGKRRPVDPFVPRELIRRFGTLERGVRVIVATYI